MLFQPLAYSISQLKILELQLGHSLMGKCPSLRPEFLEGAIKECSQYRAVFTDPGLLLPAPWSSRGDEHPTAPCPAPSPIAGGSASAASLPRGKRRKPVCAPEYLSSQEVAESAPWRCSVRAHGARAQARVRGSPWPCARTKSTPVSFPA